MPRGRPREFDVEKALDLALKVFWTKGYEGASLDDLTEAMGINRPSLYAAFGTKEQLFRRALDRYAEGPGGYMREALQEPTARAVAEKVLNGAVNMMGNRRNPRGCLIVQAALTCATAADSIRQELTARRALGEAALRERFERAIAEGDLPRDADAADLARYLVAVLWGMSVHATGGATADQLRGVVNLALRAWP